MTQMTIIRTDAYLNANYRQTQAVCGDFLFDFTTQIDGSAPRAILQCNIKGDTKTSTGGRYLKSPRLVAKYAPALEAALKAHLAKAEG